MTENARTKLTIDVDNTLLSATGSELLPGTEKLLALLCRAGIQAVIWTIGKQERIDTLITALSESSDESKNLALALVITSATYYAGQKLPGVEPFGSYNAETITQARSFYRRGIKIPLAIGATITIDDDSDVHNAAAKFGFTAIDPNLNRPKEKSGVAVVTWARSIVDQVMAVK